MTTAVIDGDVILYKAAAAGEERRIEATFKSNGKVKQFQNRTALKEFLSEKKNLNKDGTPKWTMDDFEIDDIQIPDKLENVLHTAKVMINKIVTVCNADEVEIYLGKGESFRKFLDLPSEYKGKRKDQIKPVLFDEVKEYLINHQNAILIEEIEADDMISIRTYEGFKKYRETQSDFDKVIGCTVDKDAKQTSGWLYNWDKHQEPIWIEDYGKLFKDDKGKTDGYGRAWVYYQWIFGDAVDCYKPTELYAGKFGDVAAYTALADCKTDYEAIRVVGNLYKKWYPEPVTYTTWDGREVTKDWIEIAQMYFDCAHMRRWRQDRVNIREVFENHGLVKRVK